MAELSYPVDLRYTKDHEWARTEGDKIRVGITAFAQSQLGDVVYVELPEVGTTITAGKPFGVVESTKAVSELFAPLTGKVVERNDALISTPDVINSDPYNAGWMIVVEPSGTPAGLMDQAAYLKLVQEQEH